MLIDFTVENYRSIKEPVTLSTVASSPAARENGSNGKHSPRKTDASIAEPFVVPGDRDIALLPALGIFGANASGKSNVVRALDDLLAMMSVFETSAREKLKRLTPYRLTKATTVSATKFEIRMSFRTGIFVYQLEVLHGLIVHEHCEYTPSTSHRMVARLLFDRTYDVVTNSVNWKNGTDLGKTFLPLQRSLDNSSTFMSVIVSSLDLPLFLPLKIWIGGRWIGIALGSEDFDSEITAKSLKKVFPDALSFVSKLITQFDTGIASIEIAPSDEDEPDGKVPKIWVSHNTDYDTIHWSIEEESVGTQRLFVLAYKLYEAFYFGSLVIIDELGANIHPNITKVILRLFQSKKTNPKGAQLVFTSHDNTLQRNNLLRRDQVWFTQKTSEGSTELYPLTAFHPRKDLALDKAYLDGRFGAVPLLPSDIEEMAPVFPDAKTLTPSGS